MSRVVFGPHSLYSLDWSLALCFSGLAALMAFPAPSNYSQENDSGLPDHWKFLDWILSKLMHKLIHAAGRASSSGIPADARDLALERGCVVNSKPLCYIPACLWDIVT